MMNDTNFKEAIPTSINLSVSKNLRNYQLHIWNQMQ
jgi:hypothetical protein